MRHATAPDSATRFYSKNRCCAIQQLRLYVIHAGWPMLDEMLALLYSHPQVNVDVGFISWGLPRAEFHGYLRRLVEAGFGRRVISGPIR